MTMVITAYRRDHQDHMERDPVINVSAYVGSHEFWSWLCSHGEFFRDGFGGGLYVRPVDCQAGIDWVCSSGVANQEHWLFILDTLDAAPRMYLRAEF